MQTQLPAITNGSHLPAAPALAGSPSLLDYALSIEQVGKQVGLLQGLMKEHLKPDEHYIWLPHQNPEKDKPSLSKSGAEMICLLFQIVAHLDVKRYELANGHREYEVTAFMKHLPTGAVLGQGVGLCSTLEGKYRFRKADRTCPECGKATILKSKHPGRDGSAPGWYCWTKRDGCGAQFPAGDEQIEKQETGRIEHDNPADYHNTAYKMAVKRAVVAGTIAATAASSIFTQDIEDMPEVMPKGAPEAVIIVDERERPSARRDTGRASRPAQEREYDQRPEPLRPGTHETADLPPELDGSGPDPENLPEPLPNPWMHRLELRKELADPAKGRFLFEIRNESFVTLTMPAYRNRLSPADLSNISAAMLVPEMKAAAKKAWKEQLEADAEGERE